MGNKTDIESYLSKKDPALGRAIKIVRAVRGEPLRPPPSTDTPFQALVRAIIYQRVSESAGATVYSRLEEIAGGKLTPALMLPLSVATIRKAGLALSKATYIANIVKWFEANSKMAKKIPLMSDEELVDTLTTIPGVGLWTVNVLLVFNLGRPDVPPAPDAVIRRIAQTIYGLKTLPSVDFVKDKIEKWSPYRSIATMYFYQTNKLKVTAADIRRGRVGRDRGGMRSGT
jgi:DNA-3-methyladenine glycosylase II